MSIFFIFKLKFSTCLRVWETLVSHTLIHVDSSWQIGTPTRVGVFPNKESIKLWLVCPKMILVYHFEYHWYFEKKMKYQWCYFLNNKQFNLVKNFKKVFSQKIDFYLICQINSIFLEFSRQELSTGTHICNVFSILNFGHILGKPFTKKNNYAI